MEDRLVLSAVKPIALILTTKPAPPTFQITAKATAVDLAWNKVAGASKYLIRERINGRWVQLKTLKKNTTGFTISGLSPSTAYTFDVAYVKSGRVKWMPACSVTTLPPAPAAPLWHATVVSTSEINLSWSQVPNATSYVVGQYAAKGWVEIGTTTKTSCAITGLHPGTSYSFNVAARNASGTVWGNPQQATTLAPALPPAESPPLEKDGFSLTGTVNFVISASNYVGQRTVGSGATVAFYNDGPGDHWTTTEMDQVMSALSEVDKLTGYNGQLLVDPTFGSRLVFFKTNLAHLQQIFGPGKNWSGINTEQTNERVIGMVDWNEQDANQVHQAMTTVEHEVAHNWDTTGERGRALQRRFNDTDGWVSLSVTCGLSWQWYGEEGWLPKADSRLYGSEQISRDTFTSLYGRPTSQLVSSDDGNWWRLAGLPDSSFARAYGKWSPYEDWTTTFEVYTDIAAGRAGASWRTTYSGLTNKLELMDIFIDLMGNNDGVGNLFSKTELTNYMNQFFTPQTGYQGVRRP
jgi:hypothetical protein